MTAIASNPTVPCNAASQDVGRPRIAYMMSRFPKITETFILYEMLAAENAAANVEVFPLRREPTQTMHPEAVAYVKRAHFLPLMSCEILRDNLMLLARRPGLWLRTLFTVVRANLGSRRFLNGAVAAFPLCATFARRMQESQIDHIHAHFASHSARSEEERGLHLRARGFGVDEDRPARRPVVARRSAAHWCALTAHLRSS